MLDGFIMQVGVDFLAFQPDHPNGVSPEDYADAKFKQAFAKSRAYLDPKMPDADSGNLIRSVVKLYQYDRGAKVTAKSSEIIFITKDLVAIHASGFRYDMGGSVLPDNPDPNDAMAQVMLKSVGGVWLISGYY